ncbi:MAG TPA: D-xylose ABC transporter ATP-binding protein, partial [Ruminococcaceae bacterium]|nr:D-xylose ABC transporter ATP-binding protein [Oscillospiraceae bacterium]
MDEYIVEMDHISKSFFGVKVLDDVSLHLKAGEVLALLGENGAGKSTLINILSGVYTRDEGEIRLFGKPVGDLSPKQAQEMGIAVIHQEMNLCRHLSVMENVFLGCEESHRGVIQKKEMTEKTRKILDRLHLDIDPSQTVGGLSVSKQQMVEIARALSENARVLIMDEPTSALSSNEIDDLFRIIRRLKAEGCGIIYISHRLEELSEIADRVQIMRDGRFIISRAFRDITMPEIISNMVGREIKEKFPRVEAPKGKKIFEVRHLNAGRLVRDVSLDLHAGEIVGVAGLVGAGRTETMRAIFGADPKETGRIFVDGREVTIRRPIDAIRAGIMLVPEDRRKDGLCIKQSVMFNISLPNLDLLAG